MSFLTNAFAEMNNEAVKKDKFFGQTTIPPPEVLEKTLLPQINELLRSPN